MLPLAINISWSSKLDYELGVEFIGKKVIVDLLKKFL